MAWAFSYFFDKSSLFMFLIFIKLLYAFASSIMFRFSLWMFSIKASSYTLSSETLIITQSTECKPAVWHALHLLSPAIISNKSADVSLTTIGWINPWFLIELLSSFISFSSNFFLGCFLFGVIFEISIFFYIVFILFVVCQ